MTLSVYGKLPYVKGEGQGFGVASIDFGSAVPRVLKGMVGGTEEGY